MHTTNSAERRPLMQYTFRQRLRRIWRVLPGPLRTAVKEMVATELLGEWRGDTERAIEEAAQKVKNHTLVRFSRLATLYRQVMYLDRYAIQGDLVECGVWKGGAAGAMAIAHMSSGKPPFRTLQLFDSWQGLPEPLADADGAAALALASGHGSG